MKRSFKSIEEMLIIAEARGYPSVLICTRIKDADNRDDGKEWIRLMNLLREWSKDKL